MNDYPMKSFKPTDAERALHTDIANLVKRHLTPDTPERCLAIAAQVVGQFLALQDQRKMTVEMAWQIISANIEAGNLSVINSLQHTKGSA
jgi:hypothetical protein